MGGFLACWFGRTGARYRLGQALGFIALPRRDSHSVPPRSFLGQSPLDLTPSFSSDIKERDVFEEELGVGSPMLLAEARQPPSVAQLR
jgi:hypothetical protein